MKRRDFLAAAAACGATACTLTQTDSGVTARARGRPLSSYDVQTRPLLAQMTLDEKLGQMAQGELNNLRDESDIERYFLGSVLSGGDADPVEGNGLVPWTDTVDRLIARSLDTRLGIPILYGADAVHGHSNVEGAVIFPHNVGLGCTRNPALVEAAGHVTALEMRATGVRWTFAPCIAVPHDIRWGRTYEGFSEEPELTGMLGAAAIGGLQTDDLGGFEAVLACAKHFVGDGGTSFREGGGRRALLDQGDTRLDEPTLRRIHLAPYVDAVAAGVGSIMVSYSSWNGQKVSGSERLLTEVLKHELGFEGFLISDYYAIGQIDPDYKTAVEAAVKAGMDMAMEPARYADFIGTLKALVDEGRVPMSRIDDAVTRILRVKAAMGLLDEGRPQLADRSLHASFGSRAHREIGRRAVRESLVLLKNEGVLPLPKTARKLFVTGAGADDIGRQCGGWTVRWQGQAGDVTTGTTLLDAIRQSVSPSTRVAFSADAVDAAGSDAAIVVVGEAPYAEGVGDRRDLALSDEDADLVERVAATGVPTVVIVYSGRPLILGATLERASAVVAAWLPGTEGRGITDVIFGDHAPTGRLSFTWPRTMAQVPHDEASGEPLFPFGFGMSYGA